MYQRILLPLDGSTRAEAIVPHVRSLAEKYGSQVILLQVVSPLFIPEHDEIIDGGRMKEDQKAKKNAALAYLEAVAQEFGRAPAPFFSPSARAMASISIISWGSARADTSSSVSAGQGGEK